MTFADDVVEPGPKPPDGTFRNSPSGLLRIDDAGDAFFFADVERGDAMMRWKLEFSVRAMLLCVGFWRRDICASCPSDVPTTAVDRSRLLNFSILPRNESISSSSFSLVSSSSHSFFRRSSLVFRALLLIFAASYSALFAAFSLHVSSSASDAVSHLAMRLETESCDPTPAVVCESISMSAGTRPGDFEMSDDRPSCVSNEETRLFKSGT